MTDAPDKPFEISLTILIAVSAALAGVAGYFAASESNVENDMRASGLSKLSDANTLYLEGSQTIAHDDATLVQAMILEDEGRDELARFLMEDTELVAQGFLNADLSVPPQYADVDAAWEAYLDAIYEEAGVTRAAAEADFEVSEGASSKSLDFLLSTVFLAIGGVVASVALSASNHRARAGLAALVLVIVIGATAFIGVTIV